jgi:zinc protease
MMKVITRFALVAALCATPLYAEESGPVEAPLWAFEESDIPVDPAFHFGVLDNGMRYILRENATPEGTALVRLHIGSGSLDEEDHERGLAHYLEHMAFNGSTNVPEGEMVKLLEREGLAFGAGTNASTGFETTVYKLNLPRNDLDLLDVALMLMRETASELLIEQEAVDRERGVILSERRDRRNFAYRETEDRLEFNSPDARYVDRLPIGTLDVLNNASAADIRGFYERTYVPSNAVLVIVGDFSAAEVEKRVRAKFKDWQGGLAPDDPSTGPLDIARAGETDIYIDPALSERVTVTRYTHWEDRPDTIASRQQNLLRQVGYAIINRRFQTLARSAEMPFKGAGFGTGDMFEDGRATNLIVDTGDGEWRKGLQAAAIELRRALSYGFSEAEVAEQVARIRTSLENASAASATRSNAALTAAAIALIDEEQIPSAPESALARFNAFAGNITADAALAAVKADSAALIDPLIRFRGRTEPQGGADSLRAAWREAMAVVVTPPILEDRVEFAYQEFGAPGEVISDKFDDRFGFRLIRFANGLRLNLKQTDIREDRISYRLTLDGGQLLNTPENPLMTALVSSLPSGGLGAHSQDELTSILAGRSVRFSISALADAFNMGGTTTPRDLDLQLQLLAAALTDPGYRQEGEEQFRRNLPDFFANLDSTPGRALGNRLGEILSDGDPRFTLQAEQDYAELTFAQLASDIGDRLERGAIEIALVGDFDEETAIDIVARTLGALPPREPEFNTREEARHRPFTTRRGLHEITHSGEPDQALVRMVWPTRDDSDLKAAMELSLLSRVVQIRLQDQLREDLGKTYSPSAGSSPSRVWRDYGTFSLTASVDKAEVEATRAAIRSMLQSLLVAPVEQDTLDRARQPLLENYDNMLKSLGGWMSLADRAQSEQSRLDRYFAAPDILRALEPEELMEVAKRYLAIDQAVEVLVLPHELAK